MKNKISFFVFVVMVASLMLLSPRFCESLLQLDADYNNATDIDKGGTNATTKEEARANLGAEPEMVAATQAEMAAGTETAIRKMAPASIKDAIDSQVIEDSKTVIDSSTVQVQDNGDGTVQFNVIGGGGSITFDTFPVYEDSAHSSGWAENGSLLMMWSPTLSKWLQVASLTDTLDPSPSGGTYSVGGSVSGLSGTLVLQNNLDDDETITTTGSFTFDTELADGAAYSVTVLTQPSGQSCSVTDGSGTIATADVTDVSVSCSTLGGTCESDAIAIGLHSQSSADMTNIQNVAICAYYEASCSGYIDALGFTASSLGPTENATLGIYSDKTSGCTDSEPHCPDALLADTASVAGTSTAGEYVESALDSAVSLTSGVGYWICTASANSAYLWYAATTGGDSCTQSITYTAGEMPSTLPTCGSGTTRTYNAYGVAQ